MVITEDEQSSNDMTINDTMSDDEVVASGVPPPYSLPSLRNLIFSSENDKLSSDRLSNNRSSEIVNLPFVYQTIVYPAIILQAF